MMQKIQEVVRESTKEGVVVVHAGTNNVVRLSSEEIPGIYETLNRKLNG